MGNDVSLYEEYTESMNISIYNLEATKFYGSHFCSVFTGFFLSSVTYLRTNTKSRIPGFIITTSETTDAQLHEGEMTHPS